MAISAAAKKAAAAAKKAAAAAKKTAGAAVKVGKGAQSKLSQARSRALQNIKDVKDRPGEIAARFKPAQGADPNTQASVPEQERPTRTRTAGTQSRPITGFASSVSGRTGF